MVNLHLRYVIRDTDRHGNTRFYFRCRKKGFPSTSKVRLPGLPGSKEFMEAYQAALSRKTCSFESRHLEKGSFGYVCLSYYASAAFNLLNTSTRL
jgi:hypothetical protein